MTINIKPNETLSSARVRLERPPLSFEFAKQLYALVDKNREHLQPWLNWAMRDITGKPEDSFFFLAGANEDWDNENKFEYVMFEQATHKLIGALGIMKRGGSQSRQFELGYWLDVDAWGNGYVSEAVKMAEEELFSQGAKRLVIRTDVQNEQSTNVAKRLGYELEGVHRADDYSKYSKEFRDTNWFAKVR